MLRGSAPRRTRRRRAGGQDCSSSRTARARSHRTSYRVRRSLVTASLACLRGARRQERVKAAGPVVVPVLVAAAAAPAAAAPAATTTAPAAPRAMAPRLERATSSASALESTARAAASRLDALPTAGKLYPHQRQGVAWLLDLFEHNRGGILGDDMGSVPSPRSGVRARACCWTC